MLVSLEGNLSSNSHFMAVSDDNAEDHALECSLRCHVHGGTDEIQELKAGRFSSDLPLEPLSSWSRSGAKRFFDLACVLPALIILAPVFLSIALAVWLTSAGPVLFLQKRTGRHGQIFTILKFRTMPDAADKERHAVTTTENQQFTPVGPFLRRWKLDELPQLLNVLWGDMSLVGARPKMPEHAIFHLQSRPGITGAATLAFAHEAVALADVPSEQLEAYYRTVVLPAKRELDVEYMAHATFFSDLELLVNTVLRRWDSSTMESSLNAQEFEAAGRRLHNWGSVARVLSARTLIPRSASRSVSEEQVEAS